MREEKRKGTYGEEKVGYIVTDVDSNPHICKVKPITQPNQRERNEMMGDQFSEIFPWFLQHQGQHNALLCPVRRLQQVIRLEHGLVRLVWKSLVHSRRIEVPNGRPAHYPKSIRAEYAEIYCRIKLFQKACLLRLALDPVRERNRLDDPLHDEFARERQHDDVEAHKGEIARAFVVENWGIGGRGGFPRERI